MLPRPRPVFGDFGWSASMRHLTAEIKSNFIRTPIQYGRSARGSGVNSKHPDNPAYLASFFYGRERHIPEIPVFHLKYIAREKERFVHVGSRSSVNDRSAYLDAVRGNYKFCQNIPIRLNPVSNQMEYAGYYIIDDCQVPDHDIDVTFQELVLRSLFFLGDEMVDDVPYNGSPVVRLLKDNPLKIQDLGSLRSPHKSIENDRKEYPRIYDRLSKIDAYSVDAIGGNKFPLYIIDSRERGGLPWPQMIMKELMRIRAGTSQKLEKV